MTSGDASSSKENADNENLNGLSIRQVTCSWCNAISVQPRQSQTFECPTCSLITEVKGYRLRACNVGHIRRKQQNKIQYHQQLALIYTGKKND